MIRAVVALRTDLTLRRSAAEETLRESRLAGADFLASRPSVETEGLPIRQDACLPAAHHMEIVDLRKPTLCILGGALETGNLGVSALGTSAVKGVLRAFPAARLVMQSWSSERTVRVPLAEGDVVAEAQCLFATDQLRHRFGTRHLRMHHSIASRLPARFCQAAIGLNRTLRQLHAADAVLDAAAGDSFSDIYSDKGCNWQAEIKLLVQALGKPLVLLPQTLGPFTMDRTRQLARQIIDGCALVATREIDGMRELQELFGGRLHDRVVCCPDMAFLLDPREVESGREPFAESVDERPMVGLNVSGLLYLSNRNFGVLASYPKLIDATIEWLLDRARCRVLLVPHVLSSGPVPDDLAGIDLSRDVSDSIASTILLRRWQERRPGLVGCLGGPYSASETKYFIGNCSFFIGARMHACIGAISQCIPTVTLAYSKKAAGTLGHVGVDDLVLDMRRLDAEASLRGIEQAFLRRAETAARLREAMPTVRAEAMRFFTLHLPHALRYDAGLNTTAVSDD